MNKSIFGWSYPPGAASDPYAPYNEREEESMDKVELIKFLKMIATEIAMVAGDLEVGVIDEVGESGCSSYALEAIGAATELLKQDTIE